MIYIVLLSLLIFQGSLMNISSIFNNIDELITLYLISEAFIKIIIKKKKILLYRYEIISLILLGLFALLGYISLFYSRVHSDYFFSMISGALTVKPLLIYFLVRICTDNILINERLIIGYDKFIGIILWIYFIIAIINIKFDFLESDGVRNGIKTISMGFTHPSTFEFFIISIMIIKLFVNYVLKIFPRNYYITVIQCTTLVFLAGRSKGIAFMGIFLICLFIAKYSKKFKLKYILLMSPLLVYLSYDRVVKSLLSKEEARNVLYKTSIKIANDYFPFGSGFSTFGSDFSRIRYSPLYYNYGINNVWGLSTEKSSFITDTQWAAILGESGYVGALIYAISILCILVVLYNISNIGMQKLALTSILIYGLIASISDSILVSYRGCAIFFMVAFFISMKRSSMQNNLLEDTET